MQTTSPPRTLCSLATDVPLVPSPRAHACSAPYYAGFTIDANTATPKLINLWFSDHRELHAPYTCGSPGSDPCAGQSAVSLFTIEDDRSAEVELDFVSTELRAYGYDVEATEL